MLCVFCKTLRNFVNSVTGHDCHDYIGKIQNQSKNVYRSCKTFTANVHLVKDYNMNILLKVEVISLVFERL